jgi:hypothetical protein
MNLLSLAGFDPSAGAGVLLDLNVFRALGFDGAAGFGENLKLAGGFGHGRRPGDEVSSSSRW